MPDETTTHVDVDPDGMAEVWVLLVDGSIALEVCAEDGQATVDLTPEQAETIAAGLLRAAKAARL